jgi:hypothetical protein
MNQYPNPEIANITRRISDNYPETQNPTSHPLSNEEQAAHLHGQDTPRLEYGRTPLAAKPFLRQSDANNEKISEALRRLMPRDTKPAHYNSVAVAALESAIAVLQAEITRLKS